MKTVYALAMIAMISFIGCTTVDHRSNLHSVKEQDMTVGKVQKEVRVGMSGAQVAEALGSPNIVTKDEGGDDEERSVIEQDRSRPRHVEEVSTDEENRASSNQTQASLAHR